MPNSQSKKEVAHHDILVILLGVIEKLIRVETLKQENSACTTVELTVQDTFTFIKLRQSTSVDT